MATTNAVNSPLSGTTGTGNFVGSTSPTLVTPVLGAATATSMTFSSTTGIVGTTTNNSAAAGSVGELISSVILLGAAVSVTSATAKTITSISLTAGDWDVWGTLFTLPAAGTTTSSFIGSISQTNDTLANTPALGGSITALSLAIPASTTNSAPIAATQILLGAPTTVYLVADITFAVSTMACYGNILARRRR